MARKYFFVICILLVCLQTNIVGGALGAGLLSSDDQSKSGKNLIERQLEVLEREKKSIGDAKDLNEIQEQLAQKIDAVKDQAQQGQEQNSQNGFAEKRLALMSKTYQHANELERTRKNIISIVDEHIKILNEIQNEQSDNKKPDRFRKAAPSYNDLQEYANKLYKKKTYIEELESQKNNASSDITRRKKVLNEVETEYEDKKSQQETFSTSAVAVDDSLKQLAKEHQGEIIDEQLQQLTYKRKIEKAKIKEDQLGLALIETKMMRAKEAITQLNEDYSRIKQSLYIPSSFVKESREKLEQKRREGLEKRERLNEQVHGLLPKLEKVESRLKSFVDKYDLSEQDLGSIRDWSYAPQGRDDWKMLADVGELLAEKKYLDMQIEWLEAQIEREKVKIRHDETGVDILQSWYRMSQRQGFIKRNEEIEQEIKEYERSQVQLKADLAELNQKRDKTIDLLYRLNVNLDRLSSLQDMLRDSQNELFASGAGVYKNVSSAMSKAERLLRNRIDLTAKLVEAYSTSIATTADSLQRIQDTVQELSAKGFWRRSGQSISFATVQEFSQDVNQFLSEIYARGVTIVSSLSLASVTSSLWDSLSAPYALLLFLFRLIIIVALFFLLKIYLPRLRDFCVLFESRYKTLEVIITLFGTMLGFIGTHLIDLYIWMVLLGLIAFGVISNVYFAILFYLLSIPYLLFLAHKFFRYFVTVNKQRGYVFISEDYQPRFMWVIPPLVYATIIIMFFRQAFLLDGYYDSQILLALNFILLQIALISLIGLIGKEQVLKSISGDTPILNWIEEHVSRYYYGLLVALTAVIVMSNPFVGYGRQVLYYLTRLLVIFVLIPIFSWLHETVKRSSSDLFFYYTEGDVIKERFPGGKSWYGIFVVFSFLFFVIFGLVIGSYIWGYAIGFEAVKAVANYTLYTPGIDEATGKPIYVTITSLLRMVLYVIGGVITTYIVNRFVLRRIFDPLLISAGIKSTILTLTRYIILVIALLIGLNSAGLDSLALKFAALIAVLSFAIQDPVSDFFSYFIILVQRPIKVGDLIQIDPDIFGVVRKITPRSTIVRHKNSVTFVVPNSQVITNPVRNWHFTRTFGAIPDIFIAVPFESNPEHVRKLMFEVLDENMNILKNPHPIVWLDDFLENGFQFRVRGYITADKVADLYEIASEVRIGLIKRLRKDGISLAVPTRVINIDQQNLPIPAWKKKSNESSQQVDDTSQDEA